MSFSGDYSGLKSVTDEVVKEFEFSDDAILKGVEEMLRLMDKGLCTTGQPMPMIPTYVTSVPTGKEKGTYLAVDLGGTNFRVCSVALLGDGKYEMKQSKVAVPRNLMANTTTHALFSFLATQVQDFLLKHHADHFTQEHSEMKMGFTFSFPVEQHSLNRGTLIRWSKGFDIKETVGQDVVQALQVELDALKLKVNVSALVNDTVGTLLSRSYICPGHTLMGAIFGTGTNAAYVEDIKKIKKIDPNRFPGDDIMVVNTEWGSFDVALRVLPNNQYDQFLEKNTPNPGYALYEKRISGMYLGELFRLVLVKLCNEGLLISKEEMASTETARILKTPWSLDTSYISHITDDNSIDLEIVQAEIVRALGTVNPLPREVLLNIQRIAKAIGRRAARLSAICVAGVIKHTGAVKTVSEARKNDTVNPLRHTIDIGVDGSVVRHYPGFQDILLEAVAVALGKDAANLITIGEARDGSGVGAALSALVSK